MKGDSSESGFSQQRLNHLYAFLKSQYVDTHKLAGFSMLIARHGEEVTRFAAGQADIERRRPIADDTIFRIYSMTKPITSIAFMMLVEEGLVALDDPVKKFIPEWSDLRVLVRDALSGTTAEVAPTKEMRMVDLLRHTAGLTSSVQKSSPVDEMYRTLAIDARNRGRSLKETVDLLARVPLQFSPEAQWNYSIATDIVGYLVEQLSGRSLAQFFEERIFTPLGMTDTHFDLPGQKIDRFAALYRGAPQGVLTLVDDPANSEYSVPTKQCAGGSGLVSTLDDYYRFCRMLLNGGELEGRRIVGRKTLELMTANHLPGGHDLETLSVSSFAETSYKGVGFGLGFARTLDPAACLLPGNAGDFFWGGAAGTYFWIDPKDELIVIFMTQLHPHLPRIRRQLRTLVYSAME